MAGIASQTAQAGSQWPAALKQVFEEPWRIRPAFQPIVDLEHGRVWGYQVLARFISPLHAAPPAWLEAADGLGLRRALELRLLSAGLHALADLPDRCKLLVPVTPATLLDPAAEKALARHTAELPSLVLDLTPGGERVAVDDLLDALAPVRRDGARVAVATSGAPGGLDALPRLRPDVLKVGRDFVAGLESDAARRAVVDGLVQLVGALGGRVLAVGVEDQPQLDALGAAGITLGQGFGLGRPVPSMAVTRAGATLLGA